MLPPLAATAAAAASANAYLAQLSSLVCLHVLPDTGIEEDPNEERIVYAQQPIPLPGARMLTLPQVRSPARFMCAAGQSQALYFYLLQ